MVLYHCCILALHDRSIIASKISTNMTAGLAIETLKNAIATHKLSLSKRKKTITSLFSYMHFIVLF